MLIISSFLNIYSSVNFEPAGHWVIVCTSLWLVKLIFLYFIGPVVAFLNAIIKLTQITFKAAMQEGNQSLGCREKYMYIMLFAVIQIVLYPVVNAKSWY